MVPGGTKQSQPLDQARSNGQHSVPPWYRPVPLDSKKSPICMILFVKKKETYYVNFLCLYMDILIFFFIMYIYLQTITMQTGRQCHQVTAVNYNFFFFTGTLVCCPLLKLKVISLIQNCRYFPAKDQRISTA